MNNLNFAFLVDTETYTSFLVPHAKQYIKDVFETKSEWASVSHFSKHEMIDSHGKSLKYLVDEQLALIRKRKARRYTATGRKIRNGRLLRRIKTTQELKFICGARAEQTENLIRGRRKSLPNYRDDIWRSDLGVRSWKKYRNKQFK